MDKKVLILILGLATLAGCSALKEETPLLDPDRMRALTYPSNVIGPGNIFGTSYEVFATTCGDESGKPRVHPMLHTWMCTYPELPYFVDVDPSGMRHTLFWKDRVAGLDALNGFRNKHGEPDRVMDLGDSEALRWEEVTVNGRKAHTTVHVYADHVTFGTTIGGR